MTALRPRLAAALASALADSPTGERLAEVAVEVFVEEIDKRIARRKEIEAAVDDDRLRKQCIDGANTLQRLRAALRSEP